MTLIWSQSGWKLLPIEDHETYRLPVFVPHGQWPTLHLLAALVRTLLPSLLVLFLWCSGVLAGVDDDYAERIAPLVHPAHLATLSARGANPRIQKVVYWLEMARRDKSEPAKVLSLALAKVGMTNELAAELTRDSLLRNHKIAGQLGCFDESGLDEMRRGRSPTVRKGPYAGQALSVDHIIPRSVAPELDNVLANLELLPLKLNQSKSDKVGQRQRTLAESFHRAGLLSEEGFRAVSR